MIGRSFPCFEALRKNDDAVFKDTATLILRYANNILRDPENLKYRQVRLANAIFMEKLLPVDGAVDIFFAMGFEEVRNISTVNFILVLTFLIHSVSLINSYNVVQKNTIGDNIFYKYH